MRPLVLALALLFTTSVANADEQLRQPPTLRDAAKAHFRDGLAFFQTEQFGPAIVEFEAACKPQDSHNPWIKHWGRVKADSRPKAAQTR